MALWFRRRHAYQSQASQSGSVGTGHGRTRPRSVARSGDPITADVRAASSHAGSSDLPLCALALVREPNFSELGTSLPAFRHLEFRCSAPNLRSRCRPHCRCAAVPLHDVVGHSGRARGLCPLAAQNQRGAMARGGLCHGVARLQRLSFDRLSRCHEFLRCHDCSRLLALYAARGAARAVRAGHGAGDRPLASMDETAGSCCYGCDRPVGSLCHASSWRY